MTKQDMHRNDMLVRLLKLTGQDNRSNQANTSQIAQSQAPRNSQAGDINSFQLVLADWKKIIPFFVDFCSRQTTGKPVVSTLFCCIATCFIAWAALAQLVQLVFSVNMIWIVLYPTAAVPSLSKRRPQPAKPNSWPLGEPLKNPSERADGQGGKS